MTHTWWFVHGPNCHGLVPGETREEALEALRRNSYLGAPVGEWLGNRFSVPMTRAKATETIVFARRFVGYYQPANRTFREKQSK